MAIGRPEAKLSYEGRLAAENGWSEVFAARVSREYRRFIALISIGDEELTPSDAVDQAWHLHMVYTRDYWHGMCAEIIGREIHHEPTSGGSERRDHYRQRYARTLTLYREVFQELPPADIWPSPEKRFEISFRRIDLLRSFVNGPSDLRGMAGICLFLSAFSLFGFSTLLAVLLFAAAIAQWKTADNLEEGVFHKDRGASSGGGGCGTDSGGDGGCGSGCGGGCGGCG